MVDYGDFEIILDDNVNDAFVEFSYSQDYDVSVQELFLILIAYGLVYLGYLDTNDIIGI